MSSGTKMPAIGFGTWKLSAGRETSTAVEAALKSGYRLIDTAKLYDNEASVGQAVRGSSLAREEIFVTTKLWQTDFGYDNTMTAFDESLEQLGLEYVDLYLIHWPGDDEVARHESWRALVEINGLGTAKSVGVSNFNVEQLERLIAQSRQPPAVNQIEFHPFIYDKQAPIVQYCQEKGIVVEAYSPLARASQLGNPVLTEVAKRHSKQPAQVLLRWAIQHGTVPIPKSAQPDRIKQNLDVFDFEISKAEMAQIDGLASSRSVIVG